MDNTKQKEIITDWHGKAYNFWGDYLWEKYGSRVLKLPIDAGFSCPNRDGTIGTDGCVFCSEEGSASPTAIGITDIAEQMENAKNSFKRSEADTKYIAYFQAFTNTYAPLPALKALYDRAVSVKDVTGLMIATRPDCVNDDVLDLISGYKKPGFELWLEIGMQTMHEDSLIFLRRGHNHSDTLKAINEAAARDIPVLVHIILGIPGESWTDMMKTAREISSLPVRGVKFHHLHVIKGTDLAGLYRDKTMKAISFKDYVSAIADFIERLRPDILIHRLIGDRDEKTLIAPKWALEKGTVVKAIDDEFAGRHTYQGFMLAR
ncbi:MAG: TIGR01212 family radical SAM protein [Spirochaetes bacterium]|jgi:hypothetical protein|nr:TIGR01212 family radical SAM protein [Spirochaetota bacterium]